MEGRHARAPAVARLADVLHRRAVEREDALGRQVADRAACCERTLERLGACEAEVGELDARVVAGCVDENVLRLWEMQQRWWRMVGIAIGTVRRALTLISAPRACIGYGWASRRGTDVPRWQISRSCRYCSARRI
jgi:hypothetical protein